MKSRSIIMLALLLLIIIASLYVAYFRNNPSKSTSENDNMVATLKKFNSMTSYATVKSVLGVPAQTSGLTRDYGGKISQAREWIVNNGRIYIAFEQDTASSPQKVVSIKYVNSIGETVYSYKLLRD